MQILHHFEFGSASLLGRNSKQCKICISQPDSLECNAFSKKLFYLKGVSQGKRILKSFFLNSNLVGTNLNRPNMFRTARWGYKENLLVFKVITHTSLPSCLVLIKDLYQVQETFSKLCEFSTVWADRAVFGSNEISAVKAKVCYY